MQCQQHAIENDLRTAQPSSYSSGATSPGVNQTYVVTFVNRGPAFHKPFGGVNVRVASLYGQVADDLPINECVAWQVAKLLGAPWDQLVATTVMRHLGGDWGSLADGRPGDKGPQLQAQAPPYQLASAALFDCLIGQQDRHWGNLRLSPANQLALIDHGYAFPSPGRKVHNAVLVEWCHASKRALLGPAERSALQGLIAALPATRLADILGPDRLAQMERRAQRMLAQGAILPPRML